MSILKTLKRLEFVNYLIKNRGTGSLDSLAKRSQLSKRAMTDLLTLMRGLGAEIGYDRVRQTYYYKKSGEFVRIKFMEYGESLKQEIAEFDKVNDLCFSEHATFVPCEDFFLG